MWAQRNNSNAFTRILALRMRPVTSELHERFAIPRGNTVAMVTVVTKVTTVTNVT